MRICGIFLQNEIRTGGHVRYLELLNSLALQGHTVHVYCNTELLTQLGIISCTEKILLPIHYYRESVKNFSTLFANELEIFMGLNPPPPCDYILVFGETNWRAARVLAKRTRAKILLAFRSDMVQESQLFLKHEKTSIKKKVRTLLFLQHQKRREKNIAKKAAILFFQSEADKDAFLKRNPRGKARLAVIRGDICQDRFKKAYALANQSTECKNILFVGNFGWRKGLGFLLDAVCRLEKQDRFNFTLTIIAPDSTDNTLDAFINANQLHSISYIGKQENVLEYLKNADLLVVPSLFDSYPNTVLEALHVGTPVIASATGGIPDMLQDSSLLFEAGSSEDLYERLKSLLSDSSVYLQCKNLCQKRRSHFEFNWAQEWVNKIEEPVQK